jgi:type 2A phosphatase activator TIP41
LTENNPIIWHSFIELWEDELGDNGLTSSDFRFRVMEDCFFGLIRHYLRVDEVIIRIYDTRIYHDFKWNYILREFTVREDTWENIAKAGF